MTMIDIVVEVVEVVEVVVMTMKAMVRVGIMRMEEVKIVFSQSYSQALDMISSSWNFLLLAHLVMMMVMMK